MKQIIRSLALTVVIHRISSYDEDFGHAYVTKLT